MKTNETTKSLQFFLLIASAGAVIVSALNVYLYSKQAPLIERVSLIEQARAYDAQVNARGFEHVTKSLDEIKSDIKDVKNYLNIR